MRLTNPETGPERGVFKPGPTQGPDMSRPQYPQQQIPHVVNGGLIDFHDNINRGMPEFGPGYMAAGMYPMPGAAGPATLAGFQGAGVAQMGCVSGPPTFLQVNGVVYKPVEDAVGVEAKAAAAVKTEAKEEPVKVLSERELERAIDERVQSRVSQFLSSQRHRAGREEFEPEHERRVEPYKAPRERRPESYEAPRERRPEAYEPGRGKDSAIDQAVEEEVARRIKRINASMKARA